jgi:hypothetical protein
MNPRSLEMRIPLANDALMSAPKVSYTITAEEYGREYWSWIVLQDPFNSTSQPNFSLEFNIVWNSLIFKTTGNVTMNGLLDSSTIRENMIDPKPIDNNIPLIPQPVVTNGSDAPGPPPADSLFTGRNLRKFVSYAVTLGRVVAGGRQMYQRGFFGGGNRLNLRGDQSAPEKGETGNGPKDRKSDEAINLPDMAPKKPSDIDPHPPGYIHKRGMPDYERRDDMSHNTEEEWYYDNEPNGSSEIRSTPNGSDRRRNVEDKDRCKATDGNCTPRY